MQNKKRFFYLLYGLIITLISYGYLFFNFNWKVVFPIFGIVYGIIIAKSNTFKK